MYIIYNMVTKIVTIYVLFSLRQSKAYDYHIELIVFRKYRILIFYWD